MFGLVLTLVLVGIWIYSIMDIVTTPPEDVQFLPKILWLFLVVLFMALAAVLWLLLGRRRSTVAGGAHDGSGMSHPSRQRPAWDNRGSSTDPFGIRQPRARTRRNRVQPLAPDDDPEFLRELSDRIRRGQNEDPPPPRT
jgi:hypothetical protein